MFRSLTKPTTSAMHRSVAMLALASFLAGTIGLPMPRVIQLGQAQLQPFPCQAHRCGCANAEQCWRGCCCLSNREKLAWAKQHRVTPPDHVSADAAHEQEQAAGPNNSLAAAKSCCQTSSACESVAATSEQPPALSIAPRVVVQFVPTIQARRCQGQADLWITLGAVSLPPPAFSLDVRSPLCGDASCIQQRFVFAADSPATPPPRA